MNTAHRAFVLPCPAFGIKHARPVTQNRLHRCIVRANEDKLVGKEELGDGSTLYRFGSDAEAQEYADRSAPSSASPQPEQPAEEEKAEAASSAEAAAETSSAVSEASQPEPPPPAKVKREEKKQHSRQPAADQNSIQLSEQELSHMKVTDLKELCKQHGVVGFSALRKAELVEALVALKA